MREPFPPNSVWFGLLVKNARELAAITFATTTEASVSSALHNTERVCSPRGEYRCSIVSEMPARMILLLHPQSDEAQLPWFACCLAQRGGGCAHSARCVPCRRVPQ